MADVQRACGYPSTDAPVSDANITQNILDAMDFINEYTGTVYWSIEDSGTATGGDTVTITDTGKSWTVDEWAVAGKENVVWIYEGTNSDEYRKITSNDATSLTVSPAFDNIIDATSKYRIVPPCIVENTGNNKLDGNEREEMFLDYFPIRDIQSLTLDGTSITISTIYVDEWSGKIELGQDSEVKYFPSTRRKLVEITYFYGEYPISRLVQRLCALDAGIRTYAAQIGATYDDFTSIQLPELSGSLGEPYMNIRAGLDQLRKERTEILGKLVRKKPFFVMG